MKVLKFGGSSVANPERIRNIIEILKGYYIRGEKFTVVFSAFGGITDSLLQMADLASKGEEQYLELFEVFCVRHREAATELLEGHLQQEVLLRLEENHEVLKNLLYGTFLVREASPRTLDYLLSFGERNSAFLISHVLQQTGVNSRYLDTRQLIKTNKGFGNANVDLPLTYENIRNYYESHPEIQIATGFIASAKGGLTTTLGRGGSDYTASLLAAGLHAVQIEIWTDVDGVLTADPRKVRKAFTIPTMTYAEAMEMSHFGAKVIYPPTLQPAMTQKIPLYIKNTFRPDFAGTYISFQTDPNGRAVKGISSIPEVALLTLSGSGLFGVPGIAARLFGALANAEINVILITQGSSEHAISFAVNPELAKKAKAKVESAFDHEIHRGWVDSVRIEPSLSVVAIIGENMRYRPGIAGRMFDALGKNGVNAIAIAQGSSELNISVVIQQADEAKALNALHEAFFLSDRQVLHLFMVGVGLIGSTLIQQIQKQKDYLGEKRGMEIKVVGLANSKKMYFDTDGIELDEWKEKLKGATQKMEMDLFVQEMKKMNLSNAIFLDNTASDAVTHFYEQILDSSISISTPNKIAASSAYLQYERLKKIADRRGVRFVYETNVGAGLPVLSTLKDLIDSGDQVIKIEGVLSGSLSFIFNSFREGGNFSAIVKTAQERGFTEPDPRVDLMGLDVRRKLIILAREAGFPLEAADVEIVSILPEAVEAAKTVEGFFAELEQANDYFNQLREHAKRDGKVLCVVAGLEEGRATISLRQVGPEHPFYALDGSDNMIVFTTGRYKERPLVIRGPGAGAEVTAAGVFAEIITIGSFLSK